MTYEVEQKFAVADLAAIQRKLLAISARPDKDVTQIDLYLAHPARDFAKTDEALRIRRVGEANYITYKGPKIDAETKTRREIEPELPPGEKAANQFVQLFEALGFRRVAEVCKHRRTLIVEWQAHRVEAALDEVLGVGTFVELELAADDAGLGAARSSLVALATHLGLAGAERRSYLELLLAARGSS